MVVTIVCRCMKLNQTKKVELRTYRLTGVKTEGGAVSRAAPASEKVIKCLR